MKVLIVEDQILVAEDIAADLNEMGFTVTDIAMSAAECFLSFDQIEPDIVLMDIRIKGELNGIEVAQILKNRSNPPIIFLTSNTDEATLKKALKTDPYSFISKPYNKVDLKAAIEIAFNLHNESDIPRDKNAKDSTSTFFVKSGNVFKRIKLDEIFYLEASGSYSTIFSLDNQYVVASNLQKLETKMVNHNFIRIHKSHLINLSHIDAFNQFSIIINKKSLPIGRKYREGLFNVLQKL
jgi:DNA-binding LytR/AlgR family response regulator